MPFTLTMPKLSPTMTEGTIAKWYVKEGDLIEADSLMMEVATDKATVEHNALDEGYLRKILVEEGGEAKVNQPIAIFSEEANESIDGYKPEGLVDEAPAEEDSAEPAATSSSDATPAPKQASGGGSAMAMPSFTPMPALEGYQFAEPAGPAGARPPASPLARRAAAEQGLDLSTVKGSGPRGRIMSRDLPSAQSGGLVAFGRRESPDTAPGSYEEVPLTPMRKAIGKRLQEAKTFIPHFYTTQDVDAQPMVDMREQLKAGDVKVSFNDFVVRACALALRQHPEINTGFNSDAQSIIHFQTIDLSIAVSVDGGLITPIVRHADYKSLGQLSVEVKALAAKARDGKLQPQEYQGGSFTISNLGMYGINDFAAIINPPQAAILAVGGMRDVPVVKQGGVVPGKRMMFTLSADHRVIDGAAAAAFLRTLGKLLENPALLAV